MNKSPRRIAVVGGITAISLAVAGHPCFASGNDCGTENRSSTYQRQTGDTADSTALDVTRQLKGVSEIQINVYSGELRIKPAVGPAELHLRISSPGADRPLDKYLQDLKMVDGKAVIGIRIPSKYHAVMTIAVPDSSALGSQINLGAGTLTLHATASRDNRQVNAGAGKAVLFLNDDSDYATLQANVGIGRMKDDRPNGTNAYGVSSRTLTGKGAGKIEVNVGAGEIDLEPSR